MRGRPIRPRADRYGLNAGQPDVIIRDPGTLKSSSKPTRRALRWLIRICARGQNASWRLSSNGRIIRPLLASVYISFLTLPQEEVRLSAATIPFQRASSNSRKRGDSGSPTWLTRVKTSRLLNLSMNSSIRGTSNLRVSSSCYSTRWSVVFILYSGFPISKFAQQGRGREFDFAKVAKAFADIGLDIFLLLNPSLPFLRTHNLNVEDVNGDRSSHTCLGNPRAREIMAFILGRGVDLVLVTQSPFAKGRRRCARHSEPLANGCAQQQA